MIKLIHFNDEILKLILAFLAPFEYEGVNKRMQIIARRCCKNAIHNIEKWYLRHRVPLSFEHFTPKLFLVQFHRYNISSKVLHRKCLPEYIACVLDLNLYTLRDLKHKGDKKKRKILDVMRWLRQQNISSRQYEYLCVS